MNNIYTAYYDLVGIASLLNIKENKKFSAVPVYPLFRDLCLMIYQINKEIFDDTVELDPAIKKIRHRVKLYQKKDNFKVYNRIVDLHTYQFGNDVDNLGFYLENGKVVGSTIYTTYVFQDTHFFSTNPNETKKVAFRFAEMVGETLALFSEKLREKSGYTLAPIEIPTFEYKDSKAYKTKDILNSNFYGDNQNQNVALTRLVISLQEASTCIWLYNGIYINSDNDLQIENYIVLRLLTIKFDEVMDNLKNMRKFLSDTFTLIDKQCEYDLSKIIHDFDNEVEEECRRLRNMIHYNEGSENFLDYIDQQLKIDKNYIHGISSKIINSFMIPLNDVISDYLKIDSIESMNTFSKVNRRISSLIKRKDFRSSNDY
ncbi:DNA polymerase III subunit gamma/tau [Alkalibacillus salilacus]|uniref:DNA polymerase III subunit gamma/tau n=1 Tax=Alkalibacillus salilacus TaxID=284582 RepID=A0ABT9VJ43_9BACI|nr:DNA polymerase III subunit gamma/tau [Alkalibacillus salilacus]MDQ0160865.1 hypothetical protein [Alkalibacillus salilacus]